MKRTYQNGDDQEERGKKPKNEHNIIYMKILNGKGQGTSSKIKNVELSVQQGKSSVQQGKPLVQQGKPSVQQGKPFRSSSTITRPVLGQTSDDLDSIITPKIKENINIAISSTLLQLGNEIEIPGDSKPLQNQHSGSSADESSHSNGITTIDEINRETLKILKGVPQTEAGGRNLEKNNTLTDTIQSREPSVFNMENCLKLLNNERITSLLSQADKRINTGKSNETLSPEDKLSLKIQNVCEQILSPNVPMSANIASMFAKSRNGSSKAGIIESPELMRVRIAESLLLLGELSKSSFCVGCKKPVEGDCMLHGNAMKTLTKTKAVESLPDVLTIQVSSIPNSGLGVFSLSIFEAGSLFGPMVGEELSHDENCKRTDNSFVWEVYDNSRESVAHYLDCVDQNKSNWLRYVNCARFEEEQNLIAEQYDRKIFFKAYKRILPGDELLVWYGNAYGSILKSILSLNEDGKSSNESSDLQDEEDKQAGRRDEIGGYHKCSKCSSVFISDYYLERHKTYVCPEFSEFRCNKCSRLFKNIANFRRHHRRGCDLAKTFHCIICSALFTQKANLKVHLKTHLNIRDFKCKFCDKLFSRNTFLKNHIMSVHQKEKPFVCSECGKKFSRMDSMKRHAALHEEKKAECDMCGMMYHTLNNLNMHIKRNHTAPAQMLEDRCRICFRTFKDIKSHMYYLHQKKPLEQCHICHKSYRNLMNHVKSHEKREGVKEVCKICNKSFISLNGHMKKHLNVYKKLRENGITIEEIEAELHQAKEEEKRHLEDALEVPEVGETTTVELPESVSMFANEVVETIVELPEAVSKEVPKAIEEVSQINVESKE